MPAFTSFLLIIATRSNSCSDEKVRNMKSSFSSSTSHCVTCADLVWFSVHDAIRSCARSFVTVSDETARRPRFRVRSCAFVHCSKRSSSFELTSVFRRPTSRDCPGPPAPTGPVGVELRFSPPIIGADIRRATIRDCAACALLLLKIPLDCPFWSCSFAFAAAADPEELAAFAISGFRGDAAADEDDAPFDGDGDGSIVATTSDGFATSCAVKSAARRASSSFRSCTAVASFEPPHPIT